MADVSTLRPLLRLVPMVWIACACRAPEASPSRPAAPQPTRSTAPSEASPSGPAEPARTAAPPETASAAAPAASTSAGANEPDAARRPITSRELASQPQPGRYLLDAYVIELRPCPVCRPPLRCKPCIGEHVVVADEPNPPDPTATAMLRVTADQLRRLVAGARYRLEVEVHPALGGGSGINYMEVSKVDGPLN